MAGGRVKCVCGHSASAHRRYVGVCCDGNPEFCTCTTYEADDGTDGQDDYQPPTNAVGLPI